MALSQTHLRAQRAEFLTTPAQRQQGHTYWTSDAYQAIHQPHGVTATFYCLHWLLCMITDRCTAGQMRSLMLSGGNCWRAVAMLMPLAMVISHNAYYYTRTRKFSHTLVHAETMTIAILNTICTSYNNNSVCLAKSFLALCTLLYKIVSDQRSIRKIVSDQRLIRKVVSDQI